MWLIQYNHSNWWQFNEINPNNLLQPVDFAFAVALFAVFVIVVVMLFGVVVVAVAVSTDVASMNVFE